MYTGASPVFSERRLQIVDRARQYVGTPFRHQGRRIGVGIDCIGLILCVAEDLNLKDREDKPFLRGDYPSYGPQPIDSFVHQECDRRLVRRNVWQMDEGDIVSMRVPHLPTHTAFIVKREQSLYLVHAYSGGPERTVEHILSDPWRRRIVGAFSFPEVLADG